MIDRSRFEAALSLLRAEMAAADPAEREETIGDFIALIAVMLIDSVGVDAAVARLRREADEIADDYAAPPAEEIN